MRLLAFLGVIFSFNVYAQTVQPPFFVSICSQGYAVESFALGAAKELTGEKLVDSLDTYCFGLGRSYIVSILKTQDLRRCLDVFRSSQTNGFEGEIEVMDYPAECSHVGFHYGLALLKIYARLGRSVVGSKCLDYYRAGAETARTRINRVGFSSNKDRICFNAGHYDQQSGLILHN